MKITRRSLLIAGPSLLASVALARTALAQQVMAVDKGETREIWALRSRLIFLPIHW